MHILEPYPWLTIDDIVKESIAKLVGASPEEVVMMNTLTSNIHFMMSAMYKPTPQKYKILIEKKAFPSDTHAMKSQLLHHGYSVESGLIEVAPRDGEETLHMDDIEQIISTEGDSIAVIHFSGIQYYTGQFFNMKKITSLGHQYGCIVGFDLAHAVGNVPMQLHEWEVDFATWCSYKYLNCGPGSIGGCFLHNKHTHTTGSSDSSAAVTTVTATAESTDTDAVSLQDRPRLAGWWGHRLSDRFVMSGEFISETGVNGYRVSNPSVLLIACVRASMDLFDKVSHVCAFIFSFVYSLHRCSPSYTAVIYTNTVKCTLPQAGMSQLRDKSTHLTNYLEYLLLSELPSDAIKIFTPADPTQRGCQLSITFLQYDINIIYEQLKLKNVYCDVRKPNVMRVAPTPLYNSYHDVYKFVGILKHILNNYGNVVQT